MISVGKMKVSACDEGGCNIEERPRDIGTGAESLSRLLRPSFWRCDIRWPRYGRWRLRASEGLDNKFLSREKSKDRKYH